MMPRRRKKVSLPPRGKFYSPVAALLDRRMKPASYRLYNLILALSWETGYCDLDNAELGDLLGLTREYVRSLLGEIAMDLVHVRTLDGRRVLCPTSLDLAEDSALHGRRLIETVDGTNWETIPKDKNGDEDIPSRTPHASIPAKKPGSVNYSCSDASTIVDGMNEEEESINNDLKDSFFSPNGQSSTIVDDTRQTSTIVDGKGQSSTIVDVTVKPPGIDLAFAQVMAKWDRCFGNIRTSEADIIGDFLDDPQVGAAAAQGGEQAVDWIMAAIEETDLAKANKPIKYFRAVLNDWLRRGTRTREKEQNATSTSSNSNGSETATDRDREIRTILDKWERGDLDGDAARRRLGELGYVL